MAEYIDKWHLLCDVIPRMPMETRNWKNLHQAIEDEPAADVVEKEKYDRLLENSLIVSSALQKYQKADVVEVVHGKWIPVTNGRGGSECNMCHAYAPSYQSGAEYNSPYCPNCGAKMDGGDRE